MKLIEADERYQYECCEYRIKVDNGTASVTRKDDKDRFWFLPIWVGLTRVKLEAKFCPECGIKIPHVKEKEEDEEDIVNLAISVAGGILPAPHFDGDR